MRKPLIPYINQLLSIEIQDTQIMHQAFMHTSFVNEQRYSQYTSNERLEFLGDAVLELVVSDYLYNIYPNRQEGELTRLRAQLVRESTLAFLARKHHFHQYIRLGRGEAKSGGAERDSILSDCFEAFLGGLYLDQGFDVVQQFLLKEMLQSHTELLQHVHQDYKTLFQEIVQQQGQVLIEYRLLDQQGPAHNQIFVMGLYVNHQFISQGEGRNKKQAEMAAAKQAYEQLRQEG